MTRNDGWAWSCHDDFHAAGRGRGGSHRRGPWGGGPGAPWGGGPGGPGAPWGGAPWASFLQAIFGLERGPRARRGDVRAAILVLLDEEQRNGYQLMQEIERRSQGTWRPSSGSVYPTLSQLEDEGLVAASKDESNRIYRLTERGKTHVAKHRDELGTPWEVETSGHDPRWEVMNLMREIGPALGQVMKFGTPEQLAEARRIMVEARRALYRLLADEEAAE
ncbi:MAG TPA: PadR family transcriptional regulator [Kofleriaceae bacterium]|jgi:DNA-binding PadR family transcriptional regulator|nr:PadR family transcriptional regulator [Kofleriaceae bacterium]